MADATLLTVVICTYRNPALLAGCLRSLVPEWSTDHAFDVVVVDNAVDEATREVVASFASGSAIPLRYETCHEPGLANARNHGLRGVTTEWVAWLDDDARVPSGWARRLFTAMRRAARDWACVGGPIVPFSLEPIPAWFPSALDVRSWGTSERDLVRGESFSGSNMTWRTEVLRDLGGFSPRYGMVAGKMGLGEETMVFLRGWERSPHPRYVHVPDNVVEHLLPASKARFGYWLGRQFEGGRVYARIRRDTGQADRLEVLRPGWSTVRLLAGRWRPPEHLPTRWARVLWRAGMGVAQAGRMVETIEGFRASDRG